MSLSALEQPAAAPSPSIHDAVSREARDGLTANPKTLSPWLFYDRVGSELFEQITALPEYYLTRTERSILATHADEILALASTPAAEAASPHLTLIELGAGTATKTGLLLSAAIRRQGSVVYQPVDVSETALAEAGENIRAHIPGVVVRPQVADYTREPLPLDRLPHTRTLALYIGSSIGNFSPTDAVDLLRNLRAQLLPGDALLLGADLAPSDHKTTAAILAAYDDAAGVTAAFNRNVLHRLNRELGANFRPQAFRHRARWNPVEGRIEMHLEALHEHLVQLPQDGCGGPLTLRFAAGETIHTENSYKFTEGSIRQLLARTGFAQLRAWQDPAHLFAVTLATANSRTPTDL